MQWLVLVGALALVTLGAEALVRGASALALRARLSPLVVGLTVVGFGTSSPELAASMTATLGGATDVSVGNVVGSNLFNLGAILGLTALIQPIRLRLAAVRRDWALALVASAAPLLALAAGGVLLRSTGALLVAALFGYVGWTVHASRVATRAERDTAATELEQALHLAPDGAGRGQSLTSALALVALGLAGLVFGSRWFVLAAIELSRAAGLSELVIGLTVVAAGTSLPELVTSLVAARRGSPDIAVGNVLGSNLFNSLGILGAAALLAPQDVPGRVLAIDVPLLLVGTLALWPLLRSGGALSRREGALLLGGYAVYTWTLIASGG